MITPLYTTLHKDFVAEYVTNTCTLLTHYALYIVWCTELEGTTDVTSTCTCTSIHSHQHDVDPDPLKLQIYTTVSMLSSPVQ